MYIFYYLLNKLINKKKYLKLSSSFLINYIHSLDDPPTFLFFT